MRYRQVGRTGLRVSEIAYGNWLTHGGSVTDETATACVHAALDSGITTFDTADAYAGTRAETLLGQALQGQRRDGLELMTKVFWPTGDNPNDQGLSRKHILRSCEGSLRRLRTDYLDVYQAHRYDESVPLEETLRAFDDLVRQGKVLYIGSSEWGASQISQALHVAEQLGLDRIASNQPQYNMLHRDIEQDILPLCREEGVGQLVYQALAQGVLAGRYLPGQSPQPGSRATDPDGGQYIQRLLTDDILNRVQDLRPIAADNGLSLAQLAIAWVLREPAVSAVIVGASRPEQVKDIAAASGAQLSADSIDAIDQVLYATGSALN